jgi:hypothetical protein
MDLAQLAEQFRGRRFGELVLHHVRQKNLAETLGGLKGTTGQLPSEAAINVKSWIDEVAPMGANEAFWRRDCSEVFKEVCELARHRLSAFGIDGTDDDIFNMFQMIVLNFAYGIHRHPQSKAFIQKALGIGFLRRLISLSYYV